MSFTLEKKDNSMALITVEIGEDRLEKAMQNAYTRNKKQFNIPGFRKGKVPRQIIEKMYGKNVFCQDAANDLIYEEYPAVLDECEESIVSDPEFDVTQLEAGKPFIFTALVALKPELSLGKYKGIKVEKEDTTVTEEEINEAVDQERERNSRTITIEDRPVQDKDIATIDFEGKVDGVAFEGGTGSDYPLTIGSGSFIPGFEEQLIGVSIGETKDVNVSFPEDYHAAELAGKPAVFTVTVKGIKEKQLPDADDDFASEVSEFDTLGEYRDSLRDKIKERKEAQAKSAMEDSILEKVVEDSHVELPEAMVSTQQRQMLREFDQRLRMQGMSLDTYFQFTGATEASMIEEMKPQAEKRIKTRLALEAIVAAENITASDEDLDKEAERVAAGYGMKKENFLKMLDEDKNAKKQITMDTCCNKAIDLLVENAVTE